MKTRRLFFVNFLFFFLPPSRFYGLKRILLRWAGARIGKNVRIVSTARFHLTGDLTIADHAYIGDYTIILGGAAAVTIGEHVAIGPRCLLVTGTHELYTEPGIAAGEGISLPIYVGTGVWMGAACTVLGGVRIGHSAILAAGALVNKNVAEGHCVGGVPARQISLTTRKDGR